MGQSAKTYDTGLAMIGIVLRPRNKLKKYRQINPRFLNNIIAISDSFKRALTDPPLHAIIPSLNLNSLIIFFFTKESISRHGKPKGRVAIK